MYTPRTTPVRTFFAWLVLLTLVLRSMVPVGYMPDFSGKAAIPGIAICGSGKTIPGTSKDAPGHIKRDTPCDFSLNKSFSLEGLNPPALARLIFAFIGIITLTALFLQRQRVYGNTSPRAPPTLS